MKINLLKKWCDEESGRISFLAKETGLTYNFIYQMYSGNRSVPIQQAAKIEKATHGSVSRKLLFPENWQEIWPELKLIEMGEKEIVKQFQKYGFTDEHGHPLENCADFLALAALAVKK